MKKTKSKTKQTTKIKRKITNNKLDIIIIMYV